MKKISERALDVTDPLEWIFRDADEQMLGSFRGLLMAVDEWQAETDERLRKLEDRSKPEGEKS